MKDKEKQINVSTKEEVERSNKIGKEKDELRQALLHYATAEASGGIKSLIDCEGCAFYLYENLGYRKIPEDSVVLTEEQLRAIVEEEYKKALKDKVVLTKGEHQKYCAYKIIEPQIKGCLDRERELEKTVEKLQETITDLKYDKFDLKNEISEKDNKIALLEESIDCIKFNVDFARKETAEKIFNEAIKNIKDTFEKTKGYTSCYDIVNTLIKLAKQFGVEIKE